MGGGRGTGGGAARGARADVPRCTSAWRDARQARWRRPPAYGKNDPAPTPLTSRGVGATPGPVRPRGSVSVNVLPAPGALSTVRSPPMPRARSRLIASPSPAPSCGAREARVAPARTARRCARSWSGGMPMPVSRTRDRARVGRRVARSHGARVDARRPASVNLTAFDSRLSRICCSFSRSARTRERRRRAPPTS